MLMTTRNRALYHDTIYCAFHTLMTRATVRGSGWYHYSDGELVIGTRIALGEGGPW